MGSIPGLGRSPGIGNGNPFLFPGKYPCLENSMDRGAWWALSMGGRVRHDWACMHHTVQELERTDFECSLGIRTWWALGAALLTYVTSLEWLYLFESWFNFWSEYTDSKLWLPRRLSGKESSCQCGRLRFDPWVGKIPWRRKWEPSPVLLTGKSHGQRSLAGSSPCGCKRVGHD